MPKKIEKILLLPYISDIPPAIIPPIINPIFERLATCKSAFVFGAFTYGSFFMSLIKINIDDKNTLSHNIKKQINIKINY